MGPRVERVQAPAPAPVVALAVDPRAAEQKRLLNVLRDLHVQVFNRTRQVIGANEVGTASYVPAMAVVGDPAERTLRELIASQVTLEGFEERARHVLAVRDREARDNGTLQFLGASVWGSQFGVASSMAVGEERKGPRRGDRQPSVFAALDDLGDELRAAAQGKLT